MDLGLPGIPKLLVVLARHRSETDHCVVYRFVVLVCSLEGGVDFCAGTRSLRVGIIAVFAHQSVTVCPGVSFTPYHTLPASVKRMFFPFQTSSYSLM